MGLAADVASALGVKSSGAMPAGMEGYTGRVPDSETRKILAQELRASPDDPNLRKEIKLRGFGDLLEEPVPAAGGFSAALVEQALKTSPRATIERPPEDRRRVGDKVLDAAVEGTMLPARVAANVISGTGASILSGWKGLATLASGGSLDDAVKAVQETASRGTYQPEGAAGKAAEVAQLPAEAIAAAGRIAGRTAMDLGAGPGVATAAETTVNLAPTLLMRSPYRQHLDAKAKQRLGTSSLQEISTVFSKDTTNYDVPAITRNGVKPLPAPSPPESLPPPKVRQPQPAAQPIGAAPEFKLHESSGAVEPMPPVKFGEAVEIAPPGKPLPTSESARRQQVLKSVGITETRKSALAGDMTEANTESQIARLGDESGKAMKAKLDAEREALTTHAERIVRETGGSIGTDASTLHARGDTIIAPLQSLKHHLDAQTKALYAQATERAQGKAVGLSGMRSVLADDSAFLGTVEGEALLRGIQARMKALGMVTKEGAPEPVTVAQAERMRQWLGQNWTPRTSRHIRDLTNAIDEDVMGAAGQDIYERARAVRAMRSTIFENDVIDAKGRVIPNGIAKLVDGSGKRIELLKPSEKIPDAISGLPADELAHVVKTLQSVPPELRPQAQAALAEIKAHFANRILDAGSKVNGAPRAGQWGSREVTKLLNNNAARLPQLFTPAELAKIEALNEAGNILRIEGGYPGAAAQAHNLGQALGERAITSVATGTGAFVGGAPGAALGDFLARFGIDRMQKAARMRAVEGRFTKLSDVPPK